MNTEKKTPRQAFGLPLLLSVFLTGFMLKDALAAPAPVEESKPIQGSTSSTSYSKQKDDESGNNTAHLINTIYQLRQEVMEMRGHLDEHTHLINQLQQESRDRYLDLDERISALSALSALKDKNSQD